MSRFKGKTVMVTGAGKNIGKEIALNFAAEGANVVVCDYNKENAEETVSEIKKMGADALAAVCDVRDREKIFEYVKDKGIPVCFNFPAGHIDDNRALIFGKKTSLKVGKTTKIYN